MNQIVKKKDAKCGKTAREQTQFPVRTFSHTRYICGPSKSSAFRPSIRFFAFLFHDKNLGINFELQQRLKADACRDVAFNSHSRLFGSTWQKKKKESGCGLAEKALFNSDPCSCRNGGQADRCVDFSAKEGYQKGPAGSFRASGLCGGLLRATSPVAEKTSGCAPGCAGAHFAAAVIGAHPFTGKADDRDVLHLKDLSLWSLRGVADVTNTIIPYGGKD